MIEILLFDPLTTAYLTKDYTQHILNSRSFSPILLFLMFPSKTLMTLPPFPFISVILDSFIITIIIHGGWIFPFCLLMFTEAPKPICKPLLEEQSTLAMNKESWKESSNIPKITVDSSCNHFALKNNKI